MVTQHPHLLAREACQRGQERLRRKQRREALTEFEKAIGFDPDLAEAHLEIGHLTIETEPQRAVAAYSEVVRLWPDRAESHARRGAALVRLGREDEALTDFDRALQIDPTLPQPRHDRGVILGKRMRHREAVEEFTLALESNPQSAATWFDRGCARIALGEYLQALADLDEAVRLDPREARFHYGRGVALSRLDKHEDALESFTRTHRLEPDFKDVFLERAVCLRALGQDEEALRDLGKAIGRGGSRLAEACALRSELYLRKGKMDQALADLERVVKLEPANVHALLALAGMMGEMGRSERALELCDLAASRHPDEVSVYITRAATRQGRSEWAESLPDLDRAVAMGTDQEMAYSLRGTAHRKLHRYAEGLADYRRAFELAPQEPRVLNQLAWLLVSCPDDNLRNGAEAQRLARLACSLADPPDPVHIDTLAAAHAELGEFPQAIELLRKAIPLCPPDRVEEMRQHLGEFKAGRPLRVP